jgi:FKBP-type peptidyl-prolyl cis-trans isomerase
MKPFQYYKLYSLILLILVLLAGCDGQQSTKNNKKDTQGLKEALIQANKQAVRTEEEQIIDFLRRYKWDMDETGSGLRYMIYHQGTGEPANTGDIVELEYTTRVITGDLVYSSDTTGPMIFKVGKGEVISGLEEGILLLHVGDKAKFIIPSHLAFGLTGDDDKILGKSTLIYDIEFIGKN